MPTQDSSTETQSTSDSLGIITQASRRGLIAQQSATTELDTHLETSRNIYVGFDATASSLHVGHLMPLCLARHFARNGHNVFLLLGEGTTMVGDPSGRMTGRPMLSETEISVNASAIVKTLNRMMEFESVDKPIGTITLVSNKTWLADLNLLTFLRDVGSKITMSRMLGMDSVKARLGDGLTFMEASYMLLQAFDFSELSRRHEVSVQIGGQDQWGNIITGVDLIHGNGGKAFAVTTPLLTKMDGTKMGKTSNGAVWLNPAMMSSFDFWQFWRNIEDSDVTKLLLAFTELTTEECLRLGSLPGQEINEAKKILATEVTALVHGRAEALNALAVSVANFETNTTSPQGPTLDVHDGMPLVDIMVNIGFAPSKSEARRLIAGGAVKMGLEGIKVVNDKLQMSSVLFDTPALRLEVGKRKVGFLILKGL